MSLLTPSDCNFFALAQQLQLGISERFEDVPASPGAYMLFSGSGHFVYSGKASDLRQRITDHFSPREENPLIRVLARYFIWRVTATEAAGAVLEGELYDLWLETTGTPPLANRNAPPESKAQYPKLALSKLQILANYLKTK
ncbi:MAG: GIY-YIG nuclease family protein [Verrucomicrobiota bacterium]